jgi:outer membrane lipoprotein-sorting protein
MIKRVYQSLFFILAMMLMVWPATSQSDAILGQIDRQVSFMEADFSAEYAVTRFVPNRGTSEETLAMFRRDRDDKYLVLFLEPESRRGKGYLKIGNNLWVYDPDSSRFNVTSARDRFQDSTIRNADFEPSNLAAQYRIVARESEVLGAYNTEVLSLEARTDSAPFERRKIWVDENLLIRKIEDYSASGQLLRTSAIPSYQSVSGRYVPQTIVFIDALRGAEVNGSFVSERTVITVTKPSFNDVPDVVFTQAFLERVGD